MAYQEVVNDARPTNGRSNGGGGLIEDVGTFSSDLANLASLQGQLVAADARETLSRAIPAIVGLVVAVLLAIAGTGVLLAGLALWVAQSAAMQPAQALMLTGLGALVVVALIGAISARFLGSSFTTFRRSSEEFERNLAWIKTTLTYSGR